MQWLNYLSDLSRWIGWNVPTGHGIQPSDNIGFACILKQDMKTRDETDITVLDATNYPVLGDLLSAEI